MGISLLLTLIFQPFVNSNATSSNIPTNIAISVGTNRNYQDGQLSITWDVISGASSYSVRLTNKDDGTILPILNLIGSSNNTATFNKLIGGSKYVVQVRSFDASLVPSDWSPDTNIGTPVTLPKAPNAPTFTTDIRKINVSWTALVGLENGGAAISTYSVTALDSSSGSKTTVSVDGTKSSATISGLSNGEKLSVTVTAINSVNTTGSTSDKSAEQTLADVPATMKAPTLELTSTNGEIKASWTAPSSDGGNAISSYSVRLIKDGTDYLTRNSAKATDRSYTFTDLQAARYTAKIFATNDAGDGALSPVSNSVVINSVASPTPSASATISSPPLSGGGGGGGGGGGAPAPIASIVSPAPSATAKPSTSPTPTISASPTPHVTPSPTTLETKVPAPLPSISKLAVPSQTSSSLAKSNAKVTSKPVAKKPAAKVTTRSIVQSKTSTKVPATSNKTQVNTTSTKPSISAKVKAVPSVKNNLTISCTNGKNKIKVTGATPKCPTGYWRA
jgi:hypothetical protein